MAENIWLGTSTGSVKVIKVTPGVNIDSSTKFALGLPNAMFSFTGWDAQDVVDTWTASANPDVSAITASVDGTSVIFTANTEGADFDIVVTLPSGYQSSSSTYQQITFSPAASGGTFKLTVNGLTTGSITYSNTAATLASNMQTAIAALTGFGSTDVLVTAQPSPHAFLFDFSHGQFAGLAPLTVTADRTSLTGGDATVTTTVNAVGATAVSGTTQVSTLSFPATGTHSEKISDVQVLSSNARFGTFTISISGYGTTVRLPYTAGRSQIQAAVEDIVGVGNVVVTGGPVYYPATNSNYDLTFTFVGALIGVNIPQMTITTYDSAVNEIQQIVMTGTATAGTFTLTYSGQTTAGIAFTADAPTVQAALIALSNIGNTDITCQGGPLTPSGSPTTSTVAVAQAVIVQDQSTLGGSSYVLDSSPEHLLIAATPSQKYKALLRFKVDGYSTGFVVKLVSYTSGVQVPTAVFSIFDVDNAVIPANATDYAAISLYGTGSVTGSVATTTVSTSHGTFTLKTTSFDLSSLVAHARSRAGWRDGNYVVFQIDANDATYTLDFISSAQNGSLSGTTYVNPSAPVASNTIIPGTYGPITLSFQGALGGANLTQVTSNSAGLTGGSVATSTILDGGTATYTPSTTTDGAVATVANIKGGTFSLTIKGVTVASIPYNVSAASLVTLVNTAFGSTVCTATGGPAPDTPIVITFAGVLATQPLTIDFRNALQTNLIGSVIQTKLQAGVTPVVPTNVWDITVCPGRGTLGLTDDAAMRLSMSHTLSTVKSSSGFTPVGDAVLKLATMNATTIQGAINELFAADVCRVTQVGHSEEVSKIQINPVGEYTNIWYIKDIYRVVFVNDYAAAGTTVLSAQFEPNSSGNALPEAFMSYVVNSTINPDTNDHIDEYPEDKRVVLGFVAMQSTTTPLHICKATLSSAVPKNNLSWRFKLMALLALGDGSSGVTPNAGIVQAPGAAKIAFQWCRQVINDLGIVTSTVLQTSATIPWNSPATAIQTTLQDMFFGPGNILATGSLVNSWKSESLLDAPITDPYNELHVTLAGVFAGLPIDDYDYSLVMTLVDNDKGESAYQKPFQVYGTQLTKTLPPHKNRRESLFISSPESLSKLSLGTCTALAQVSPLANADAIQVALDGLYSGFTSTVTPFLPEVFIHPIKVYGTNLADGPLEFEFVSGGSQFRDDVTIVIASEPLNVVIGKVVATTPGVLAVAAIDANQLVTITGKPYGGTFTLTWGGNTTAALAYNVSLSALQAAVTTAGFSSPTITGNADNGFTFVWAGAGGPRAAITSTPSLNNADSVIDILHTGGQSATFKITSLGSGKGPNYLDDPLNFSLGRVLNSGDTLIVDDSASAILYGLELTSVFDIDQLKVGSQTLFKHSRNRRVFEPGQQVVFKTTGAAPTGMTDGATYTIDAVEQISLNNFTLLDSTGAQVKVSLPGTGTMTLTVANLAVKVYSRYTGAKIGLPHTSPLPSFVKAKFSTIEIGLGAGDGLTLGAFDCMDSAPVITIYDSAQPDNTALAALFFNVNNASATLTQKAGYTGVNFYAGTNGIIGAVIVDAGSFTAANTILSSIKSQEGSTVRLLSCSIGGSVNIG